MPEGPCKKVRLRSLPQVFCLWTPRCLALLGWYQRVWYQGVTLAKQKLFSLISLENIPKENQLEVLLYSKNGCSLKSGIAHLASNVLSLSDFQLSKQFKRVGCLYGTSPGFFSRIDSSTFAEIQWLSFASTGWAVCCRITATLQTRSAKGFFESCLLKRSDVHHQVGLTYD